MNVMISKTEKEQGNRRRNKYSDENLVVQRHYWQY